jgi:hypothetical protein
MPNKVLAATVSKVLSHPAIWFINFEMNGLVVTGQRYRMVAQAVESGRITCEVGVGQSKDIPSGSVTVALYDPDRDQFRFPYENFGAVGGREKLTIVHEATHAVFDLFSAKETRVLAIDDEAAACLSTALLSRISELSFGGGILIGSSTDEALKVADIILAETGDFQRDRRTYFVRPSTITKLRQAIAVDWNLLDGRAGIVDIYNGVR